MTESNPNAHEGHEGCHYLPGVLAVRPVDANEARDFLGIDPDATPPLEELWERISDEADEIQERITLLPVDYPHRAAAMLAHRERPIDASPIHGVGYLSHGRFMSGPGPDECEGELSVADPDDCPRPIVAVVDSGIVDETERPEYLTGDHVIDDDKGADREDNTPSHGTFVAGLIRQTAKQCVVSIAAAKPDTGLLTTDGPGSDVHSDPTTEIDVFAAIIRLVRRHESDKNHVKALNLSLGASACTTNDGFLLTLRQAIEYWREHMGRNAPIFAAGGNSEDPEPVYPAAFECVRGVAALDADDNQVVWRHTGNGDLEPTKPKHRWWITDEAPGTDRKGPDGSSRNDVPNVKCWSGSSFATAIASAQTVVGEQYEVNQGIVRWSE